MIDVEMDDLIATLVDEGYLKTPRIIDAFRAIHRKDFLTEDMRSHAAANAPLTIGFGQTISQPLTVAFMLELLQPEPGERILDVGYGSGWQTALLAHIVGKKGSVIAIERIRPLAEFGQRNVERYHFPNVTFHVGDGSLGDIQHAPFDKIVVAAAGLRVPQPLLNQLRPGGTLVMPVGQYEQDIVEVRKKKDGTFSEKRHPGFQFVPLVLAEWGKESE